MIQFYNEQKQIEESGQKVSWARIREEHRTVRKCIFQRSHTGNITTDETYTHTHKHTLKKV